MAIVYKVIFEKKGEDFKIAGISNNKVDTNKIAGSISSKGMNYSAVIIDYSCNTALHNDCYIVYTREFDDDNISTKDDTFHKLFMELGSEYPTNNDMYVYKLEKSALDRVDKINNEFTRTELKHKKAEIVHVTMNSIY